MTTEQNRQLIRDYIDLAASDKQALIDKYVADPELKEHIILFEEAMPGYQLHVEDILADGDKVVVRAQTVGTHTGPLFGVPGSGREVRVPLIIIYQIENGKIVDHWMQADTLSLMQQIGAVPVAEVEA